EGGDQARAGPGGDRAVDEHAARHGAPAGLPRSPRLAPPGRRSTAGQRTDRPAPDPDHRGELMVATSSTTDTRAYLEALFGNKPAEACVLIWTLKKGPPEEKRSAWFTDLDEAAAAAGITDRHVYAGMSVTTEDRGPYLRYEHAHAAGIGGLWLDLDVLSPAHK